MYLKRRVRSKKLLGAPGLTTRNKKLESCLESTRLEARNVGFVLERPALISQHSNGLQRASLSTPCGTSRVDNCLSSNAASGCLLLVVRPGAPGSVLALAPSSDARSPS